jgi:hypothetical protein
MIVTPCGGSFIIIQVAGNGGTFSEIKVNQLCVLIQNIILLTLNCVKVYKKDAVFLLYIGHPFCNEKVTL